MIAFHVHIMNRNAIFDSRAFLEFILNLFISIWTYGHISVYNTIVFIIMIQGHKSTLLIILQCDDYNLLLLVFYDEYAKKISQNFFTLVQKFKFSIA